jgi:uncharacterized protein YdaU (DUF1376 family)
MSKVDLWMPLYIGDYLSATSRLTTEQHGAYLLLIMDYWKNGPLPKDDAVLAQITRLSADAWSNARSIVLAFFEHGTEHYTHKRIDAEMASAKVQKDKKVAKAKVAAAKRWADHAPSNATSNAQAMLEQCPSPSPCVPKGTNITKATKSDDLEAKERRAKVWNCYSTAYASRYGVPPVRNAKVSASVAQLVSRIGADDAEAMAGWFVSHPDNFYAKNLHDFGLLLKDCEKLRTQWATGRTVANQQQSNGYKSRADALADTARALTTSQPIERVINPF